MAERKYPGGAHNDPFNFMVDEVNQQGALIEHKAGADNALAAAAAYRVLAEQCRQSVIQLRSRSRIISQTEPASVSHDIPPEKEIAINTIGALIDYDYTLRVYCQARDCHNGALIDLEALALKIGRDHSSLAPDIKPYFKCTICGSKEVSFTISASNSKFTSAPAIGGDGGQRDNAEPHGRRRKRRSRR